MSIVQPPAKRSAEESITCLRAGVELPDGTYEATPLGVPQGGPLGGMVDRSRRQLGLFRILLIIVSAIIMALILYTLTLDKLHDVAMLKLMGARNSVILNLILQQALLLGTLAYGVGYVIGQWAFPLFPRRVIVTAEDLWLLAGIVLGISVLASLLGIAKALSVEPNEVLS